MEETKEQYVNRLLKKYTRKDLLAACRMVGLAAHRLKTRIEIARLLYEEKNGPK